MRKCLLFLLFLVTQSHAQSWIPAIDSTRVASTGDWWVGSYQSAERPALGTTEDGAAVTVPFEGETLVLRFGQQGLPSNYADTFGYVRVEIDGESIVRVDPLADALEVVVGRNLGEGRHELRIVHEGNGSRTGVLIEQIGLFGSEVGEIAFSVTALKQAYLIDCRVTVTQHGKTVRSALSRNLRSGRCRLAGLPAGEGYRVNVQALGWESWTSDEIVVASGEEADLGSVFLRRSADANVRGVRFPTFGRPAIREPGESFNARFGAYGSGIDRVQIEREVGPAKITRTISFRVAEDRAFYYDQEIVGTISKDTPPGVYDLVISLKEVGWSSQRRAPRSIYVPRRRPGKDPVFMTWGHYDTWGQYQAEYLSRVADAANLLGADMVLISNVTNPAYVTGALAEMDLPYMVTFGNHQYYGHEQWYGHPVHRVDFGDISILNFGLAWHEDIGLADKLLSETEASVRVINGFEANAPVEFLDRHRVSFINDAHGPGTKVTQYGATPTQRAGKINSMSFRLVRFKDGKVVSCTYAGGNDQAPIPFPREGQLPIRVEWNGSNDGTQRAVTATVVNDLFEAYPGDAVSRS